MWDNNTALCIVCKWLQEILLLCTQRQAAEVRAARQQTRSGAGISTGNTWSIVVSKTSSSCSSTRWLRQHSASSCGQA
jgi:NADH:ubiquinone oxidoreductase subunit F (NADH-binding)